jgi:hypothetical protein
MCFLRVSFIGISRRSPFFVISSKIKPCLKSICSYFKLSISLFLIPVFSAVITIGLRCDSQLLISSLHSSFERYRNLLLFSSKSLTFLICFKVSSSTISQSTALVNICFKVAKSLLIMAGLLPYSNLSVWNCSMSIVLKLLNGRFPYLSTN